MGEVQLQVASRRPGNTPALASQGVCWLPLLPSRARHMRRCSSAGSLLCLAHTSAPPLPLSARLQLHPQGVGPGGGGQPHGRLRHVRAGAGGR
jgi:hypothetical protein